jgi:hypothetical protein
MLRQASEKTATQPFVCEVFEDPQWNSFVELWAPRIYTFIREALGSYATEPRPTIIPLDAGFHIAGANASFNIVTGQIQLTPAMAGNPGVILEKLTHEMVHGSLAAFPEGDPFYEEGMAADYGTWILAHAPVWEPYRDMMIKAAADNIRNRRDRAMATDSDYDRKRWAGGVYAMTAFGPHLITRLRQKKECGDLTW